MIGVLRVKISLYCYECAETEERASIIGGQGKVGLIRTSGKFGHTFANSVNPDETAPYEPSHQDLGCLLSLFIFYSNQ